MPIHPTHGFEEMQRQALARLYGRMIGIRAAAIPLVVIIATGVIAFDPTPWRRWAMVGAGVLISGFFAVEYVRYHRRGIGPASIPFNLALAVAGQTIVAALTGALESPFVHVFVLVSFLLGVVVPLGARRLLLGAQILAVWCLAALELGGWVDQLNLAAFGGGHRAGHNDALLVTTAVVLTAVLIGAQAIGLGVRRAFVAMMHRAATAQEESLRAHAERAAELGALSAEIAHELKNPLASVKGLSGLLVQHLPAGKGAERLAVLRREVERMQGILDEFLNFSRPLVPLSRSEVDLASLLWEVAALHEGVAEERHVRLLVRAVPVAVTCDARKVKQVLINLVHNALDASEAGGQVELRLEPVEDGARILVVDRGRGLAPDLAGRVFEPGVTSKPHGSGLGLTIARAIARQHGGDLSLRARPEGGCEAELHLPHRPAPELVEARPAPMEESR